jgi:hypothetical protein
MGIKSSEERSVAKRAAKERESAALALKNRAKKGCVRFTDDPGWWWIPASLLSTAFRSLLSEDENVRYATMQAMEARGAAGKKGNQDAGGGKDCCVS